ncbi:MAG: hypothetical protein AAGC71_11720 [Pseudomonadota bacterium]
MRAQRFVADNAAMAKKTGKKIGKPNALLAAARSPELRQRVVTDKTRYRRKGKNAQRWRREVD